MIKVTKTENINQEPEKEFEFHKKLRDKNKVPLLIEFNGSFIYFADKKEFEGKEIEEKAVKMQESLKQFNKEFEDKFNCFLGSTNLMCKNLPSLPQNFIDEFLEEH